MQGQIDFNDILEGKEVKKATVQQPKLKESETRQRQQSCMASEVAKDLLPSNTPLIAPNFRVSLLDMLNIDKGDESLQRYKKNLLGQIKEEMLKEDEPAEVEIYRIDIVSSERPKGPIILDFRHGVKTQQQFTLKEGSVYNMRVYFVVRNDIVFGLKFVNNVYKMMSKVDKDQDNMGSFAPQAKEHVFNLPLTQAPAGFMVRGSYKGKGLFVDKDGIVHMQFEYIMNISSEW